MKKLTSIIASILIIISFLLSSCIQNNDSSAKSETTIVVTYSVLGAIVGELVGDQANVIVSIPNGLNLHEWEPSAKDIEALNNADLIVRNGLSLEAGLEKTLDTAASSGVPIFTASDHIEIRYVGEGEMNEHEEELEDGEEEHEHHHEAGSADPHIWTDPLTMKNVVRALSLELKNTLGIDVSNKAAELETRLDDLDAEIRQTLAVVPEEERYLVTGHESMGYYADRYDFKVIGAIIPSISTQAEVSAGGLAELKELIEQYNVKAIFTETGTSPVVAGAIADETGAKAVELNTHVLPDDGSYFSMMREITSVIADALK